MEDSVVLRLFELVATLGTGTVFGGLILWWFLKWHTKKMDQLIITLLAVVQSISMLRTQHLMHEATVHGVNASTGETQDERTAALWQKFQLLEQENHATNELIKSTVEALKPKD